MGCDRPSVLMVSKPVVPPWNDSNKNLVRDIVAQCTAGTFHVMTVPGYVPDGPCVEPVPLYPGKGAYSPGLAANLRVLGHLLRPSGYDLYHFFFAPNPRSSGVASLAMRLRRARSIQTVVSVPRSFEPKLFFGDLVVTLSRSTKERLLDAGVPRVETIYPGVPERPLDDPARVARMRSTLELEPGAMVVLFAGDYEFSDAAKTVALSIPEVVAMVPEAVVVFACRLKTPRARELEGEIRALVSGMGLGAHVRFLNEVEDMQALVAAASVQVMPSDTTYAKMDLPLVLLESMREGVPVVVGDVAPLNEILEGDPEAGRVVPPGDPGALAAVLVELLRDHGRLAAMGARAKALVMARFGARAMAARYDELYGRMLG